MVLHDADDMEAISNDSCFGKVGSDQSTIRVAQIDADHPYLVPALKGQEESFKGGGTFSFDYIKDPVALEIAKGGGKAAASVKGMFIDPEHLGAGATEAFLGLALSELLVDALNGSGSQTGQGGHTGTTDPLVMIAVDALPKGFGGMPSWQDAGQGLDETLLAMGADEASAHDKEPGVSPEAFQMAHPPTVPALAVAQQSAHFSKIFEQNRRFDSLEGLSGLRLGSWGAFMGYFPFPQSLMMNRNTTLSR